MLTRETSSVMRFLSPESVGAVLSVFLPESLDWPERSRANRQNVKKKCNFFMSGESIIRRWRGGRRSALKCGTLLKIGTALEQSFKGEVEMNKFFFSAIAACGLLSLLLLTPAAWAQDATGKIAGNVTDATGALVAGATVVVTNLDTQTNKQTLTDN